MLTRRQRSCPRLAGTEVARPPSAFDEVLEGAEERFSAAFDEGVGRLSLVVAEASGREEGWLERVRAGVVALLGFFDDEPWLGRLLIVDAPLAGAVAPECRRRLFGVLGGLVAEGGAQASAQIMPSPAQTAEPELMPSQTLTAELVLGGVFSVIQARMIEGSGRASEGGGGPLVELAPSLVSFIVTAYLRRSGASAERSGARPLAGESAGVGSSSEGDGSSSAGEGSSRPAGLPIRATYRTMCVLRAISSLPRSSNREVAEAAGLADEGQTSKLLGRLESRGLIENVGLGAAHGEPNAWLLTPYGRRAVAELNRRGLALTPSRRTLRWGGAEGSRRPHEL